MQVSNPYIVIVFVLAVFASACIDLSWAFRNRMRTVKVCETNSEFVQDVNNQMGCELHCRDKYVNVSPEVQQANRKLGQYNVTLVQNNDGSQTSMCCCTFNAPWPEFIKAEMLGLANRAHTTNSLKSCLPLVLTFGLSDRTTRSYRQMCRYLSKAEPLTVIELKHFVELAKYLNLVKPKNQSIMLTLASKSVKRIDKKVLATVMEAFNDPSLYNSYKPLEQFEGYRFDPSTMIKLETVRRQLLADTYLASVYITKSFDEYVISYAIMDLTAANKRVFEVNQDLGLPSEMFTSAEDTTRMDQETRSRKFSLPSNNKLDCQVLRQTKDRLAKYVTAVQRTLSSLDEKGMFELMERHYNEAKQVANADRIYKILVAINCVSLPPRRVQRAK